MGDERFGNRLVEEGLVNQRQLDEAIQIQQQGNTNKPIGQILQELGVLTKRQLDFVLDKYKKRNYLGEILVNRKEINREQLKFALEEQKVSGLPLGETLVRLNFITEEIMRESLCVQLNIAFIDLEKYHLPDDLKKLINRNYARKHSIIPVSRIGSNITLAMNDPTDRAVIEELQSFTGLTINPVTSTQTSIKRAFNRLYGDEKIEEPGDRQRYDVILEESKKSPDEPEQPDEDQALRKADQIVRDIIRAATEHGASDIHLETLERQMTVRFRIDGVLKDLAIPNLEEALAANQRSITSRLKILACLDIAEKRRPQDGSFRVLTHRGGEMIHLDFRLSVIPGYHGENVVLRILDQRAAPRSIKQLGFYDQIDKELRKALSSTEGIFLVTGPTGSGKSTTLFGILMHLHKPTVKILTAEDPIEYVYESFIQCEVNERIGNTFAGYLRSFLRHDPEVIMVGEIRDQETAEMAFRAAQTGHMLLSTLHTNDAVSAVTRLMDMGVDKNLIASSLRGVLAQRLVRQICTECKEEYSPPGGSDQGVFQLSRHRHHLVQGGGMSALQLYRVQGTDGAGRIVDPQRERHSDDQQGSAHRGDQTERLGEHRLYDGRCDGQTEGGQNKPRRADPHAPLFQRVSQPSEDGRKGEASQKTGP